MPAVTEEDVFRVMELEWIRSSSPLTCPAEHLLIHDVAPELRNADP